MSSSNRFSQLLYESGQGWGKEIMPYLSKPEIRTLNVINKGCHHAVLRKPVKKGWDWKFKNIKGDIKTEIKSPFEYPELIFSTENELFVSGRLTHFIYVISKENHQVIRRLTCEDEEYGVWKMFKIGTEIYVLLYKKIIVLKSSWDDTVVREWPCLGLDMTFTSDKIIVLFEYTLTFYDYYGTFLYTLPIPTKTPCKSIKSIKSIVAIYDDIAFFDFDRKKVLVMSLDGHIKYSIPCSFVKTHWVNMTFIPEVEEIIVCDNNSSIVGALDTYSKKSRFIHSNFFEYPHQSVNTTDGLYVVVRNHHKIYLLD